jgi:hypothetical protein
LIRIARFRPSSRLLPLLALTAVLSWLIAPAAQAREAWLVTYGPGQEVWERFGHNAIWLRDPAMGLDHVYSFGYFDMTRPGFHADFARGIMRYFGSVSAPEDEFAFYRSRERSISRQRLNLSDEQFLELQRLLHENIFPIPQLYDYDYFFDNCSTWLRDLIDEVADGALREQLGDQPARLNFRDHIRRYNESRLELHAGLLLLLGPMIDRPRTAWEEGFIPAGLAHWIASVEVDGRPLVGEVDRLYESSVHEAPVRPNALWWAYALVSVLLAATILAAARRGHGFWPMLPWRTAVVAVGLSGGLIALMGLATRHDSIDGNLAVLLLNPFWLVMLLPLPAWARRVLLWLLAAAAAAGVVLLVWPGGPQFRPQVVAGLLPVLAALFWVAFSRPPQSVSLRS